MEISMDSDKWTGHCVTSKADTLDPHVKLSRIVKQGDGTDEEEGFGSSDMGCLCDLNSLMCDGGDSWLVIHD